MDKTKSSPIPDKIPVTKPNEQDLRLAAERERAVQQGLVDPKFVRGTIEPTVKKVG